MPCSFPQCLQLANTKAREGTGPQIKLRTVNIPLESCQDSQASARQVPAAPASPHSISQLQCWPGLPLVGPLSPAPSIGTYAGEGGIKQTTKVKYLNLPIGKKKVRFRLCPQKNVITRQNRDGNLTVFRWLNIKAINFLMVSFRNNLNGLRDLLRVSWSHVLMTMSRICHSRFLSN